MGLGRLEGGETPPALSSISNRRQENASSYHRSGNDDKRHSLSYHRFRIEGKRTPPPIIDRETMIRGTPALSPISNRKQENASSYHRSGNEDKRHPLPYHRFRIEGKRTPPLIIDRETRIRGTPLTSPISNRRQENANGLLFDHRRQLVTFSKYRVCRSDRQLRGRGRTVRIRDGLFLPRSCARGLDGSGRRLLMRRVYQ